MTAGLVIVTYNSAAHIGRCLDAVRAQTRTPDRIVVADSGSSDATIAIVEAIAQKARPRVEVLRLVENVGFAVANNRAVDILGECDLIALLNPDAFPDPGWLAALLAAAASHPEAASFASRLMVDGRDGMLDGAGDVFHVSGLAWRHGHRQPLVDVADALTPRDVFAACAAAALYRREDWRRAGGFDERYFCYAEDVDLGFRLQLLGRGCRYVPDAVVHHVGSAATSPHSPFSVYHGYRNLEWTWLKNMPTRLFWRYLVAHLIATVAAAGWFLAHGRGGSLLRAKWDALSDFRRVREDRKRIQARRLIGDDALQALLDRSPLFSRFATRAGRL